MPLLIKCIFLFIIWGKKYISFINTMKSNCRTKIQ